MQKILEAPHAPVRHLSTTKQITVIIPVRIDETNTFRLARLGYILQDPSAHEYVDVIVADDGSPVEFAAAIAEACRINGFRYQRLNTSNKMVSMARARNRAAQIATTTYIFFMDADLLPPAGFFRKLAEEVRIVGLDSKAEDMVMVPVAYLNEAATDDYLAKDGAHRLSEFMDHTINRNEAVIERYSSGTSACVYNRLYYLARGGYIEDFAGWGYEDLEFNLRIARLSKRFPLPADYTLDEFSFDRQYEYKGWKAIYRLFGDRSLFKGLLLFHAHHPIDRQSPYQKQRRNNEVRFNQQIADFAVNGSEPEPLADPAYGRSLMLKRSPFTHSRILRPMLGEVVHADPEQMPSNSALAEMMADRQIDRIVFQNPYASPETQRIYDWARANRFPFLICERGALNRSILFDRTGFLADSSMFDAQHWDRPLTDSESRALDAYVQDVTSTSESLEAQSGKRLGAAALREVIGATSADTVVLVCLQRPSDTATRFFPGPMGTYGDFIWAVGQLSQRLPHNVRLVFKVHPLEDHVPDISGVNVSEYHINDLMEAADKLLIFNSGTGITAMLYNLPIIACGSAFYGQPNLVHTPRTPADLYDIVCSDLSIDEEARRRFLHYLRFSYYSFGEFVTRPVRMPDGSRMTATTDIRFETVRGFGNCNLQFANRSEPEDRWQSMLFDRFIAMRSKTAPMPKPHARWGGGRRAVFLSARCILHPLLSPTDRRRLHNNPLDFFKKAKWWPNRFFGRLLLDKSQRPY